VSIDVRKKLTRSQKLIYAAIPVVLAGVSLILGGNQAWMLLAALGALGIILLAVSGLRVVAQRDLSLRDFLVLGYLLVCWGAWTAVGYFLPVTTVHVKGDLLDKMADEPSCPLRVSYAGQVRVELDRCRECSFQFRGRFQREQLKIEMLSTVGWIKRKFGGYGDEVRLEKIPTTRLYIDNRGNGEVKLVCGQLSLDIAADSKECVKIPALAERDFCFLKLNGKQVGAIEGENVLVDTLGTRSYRLREIVYGHDWGMPLVPGGRDLRRALGSVFRQAHVHKLSEKLDYFLEPSPEKIEVTTFGGFSLGQHVRSELSEMEP